MKLSNLVIRYLVLSLLPIIFISCASVRYDTHPESGYAVASWYGPDFHGKPTSSGEIFNMYAYTCAHKEYPFGTRLSVTNISNNKAVNCIVNDRGPFVEGRDLDLSYAAAKKIDLISQGVGKIWIEYAGRDLSYMKEVKSLSTIGPFTVQIGSFRDPSNAIRLKTALKIKYNRVYIMESEVDGDIYYRVRIGEFCSEKDAYNLAEILADEGYSVLITGYEEEI